MQPQPQRSPLNSILTHFHTTPPSPSSFKPHLTPASVQPYLIHTPSTLLASTPNRLSIFLPRPSTWLRGCQAARCEQLCAEVNEKYAKPLKRLKARPFPLSTLPTAHHTPFFSLPAYFSFLSPTSSHLTTFRFPRPTPTPPHHHAPPPPYHVSLSANTPLPHGIPIHHHTTLSRFPTHPPPLCICRRSRMHSTHHSRHTRRALWRVAPYQGGRGEEMIAMSTNDDDDDYWC